MKAVLIGAVGVLVCFMASARATVDFSTVTDSNVVVTGIRSDSVTQGNDSVVITASYNIGGGNTAAALYEGSLAGATLPGAVWNQLTPDIGVESVTGASFYGPNTAVFSPSLGAGNVVVVGSYKYSESPTGAEADHGLMYQGTVTGSGTWTQIDATPLATGSTTVTNTIAHSTMGGLVVGNYATGPTGKAFIFKIADGNSGWTDLNPAGSLSVTAYGIWQNGSSGTSTSYTIAGGFSDLNSAGLDEGYLVDYDSATGELSNYKTYNYDDLPLTSFTSHFDGITATADGFNLTGVYLTADGLTEGGFLASVKVNLDGSFSDAVWTDVTIPSADATTGNTVIGDDVLGIYVDGGSHSYVAAVPEPSTFLEVGAALLLGIVLRKGRVVRLRKL